MITNMNGLGGGGGHLLGWSCSIKNEYNADLWIAGETFFLIMKRVRNVFPNYDFRGAKRLSDQGAKRFSKIWRGGETSCLIMKWVRNVFLKYGLGAKRLSNIWFGCETSFWNNGLGAKRLCEIWFGCETSFWTMKTGAKSLSYLWGGGVTSFLSMSWGRNVSLKNGANWLWGEKSVYHIYTPGLSIYISIGPIYIYLYHYIYRGI